MHNHFRHTALLQRADDNSLIGCTNHNLTADWSLASTHFVDSQYANFTDGNILLTERTQTIKFTYSTSA